MFFIVIYHFCTHGIGSDYSFNNHSFYGVINLVFCDLLLVLSSICVNLYILISGYFLVYTNFKFSRIIRTWLLTCFYCFVITLTFFFVIPSSVSTVSLIKSLFPLSTDHYWFVTQYIGMLLLSPYLGIIARVITRRQYIFLLIAFGFICLSLIPDFPLGKRFHVAHGNSVMFFAYLFFVAGFIRRFVGQLSIKIIAVSVAVVLAFMLFLTLYIDQRHLLWFDYNGIPFILSVLVFILFKQIKMQPFGMAKLLVDLAPYTFAVYLLHDHLLVRNWIWASLNLQIFCDEFFFPIMTVSICCFIFSIGVGLDWIRKNIFRLLGIDNLIIRVDDYLCFPNENGHEKE